MTAKQVEKSAEIVEERDITAAIKAQEDRRKKTQGHAENGSKNPEEEDLVKAAAERDSKQAKAERKLYQKPTVHSLVISHTFNSPYVLRLYDTANLSTKNDSCANEDAKEAAKQAAG